MVEASSAAKEAAIGAAIASVVAAVTSLGCGPPASPSPPAVTTASTPPAGPRRPPATLPAEMAPLARSPVGRVRSPRFGLTLALPDADRWQLVRDRSSFLILDHRPSSSRLVLRLWREAETVNRDRCEQQARALRALPPRSAGEVISRRRLDVPPEFDTLVEVGVVRGEPGAPVTGYVMAFGGWVRRCFAFVYTTSAARPDAERLVGDRLAVIEARTLEGLEVVADTDLPRPSLP